MTNNVLPNILVPDVLLLLPGVNIDPRLAEQLQVLLREQLLFLLAEDHRVIQNFLFQRSGGEVEGLFAEVLRNELLLAEVPTAAVLVAEVPAVGGVQRLLVHHNLGATHNSSHVWNYVKRDLLLELFFYIYETVPKV